MSASVFEYRRFKHLIFDLDGVLIDSSPCHENAYAELWRTLGISGPDYSKIAGRRTIEVVRQVTQELSPSEVQLGEWVSTKQETARNNMADGLLVFTDSVQAVRQLTGQGLILSLATGASLKSANIALQKMGIFDCFTTIVTAEDVPKGKPDPMVFQRAMECTTISQEETLVIEDSVAGIQAAVAAGAFVCSVRTGEQYKSDLFAGSFPDIPTALSKLGVCK